MTKKDNITGIILAGGKSSRMGNDKGLLKINNKTFIELVIEAMKPLVNDILIVSNNPDHDKFGYERIGDIISDSGPLAGIHAALNHTSTRHNMVLSCDIPLITTEVLNKLIETDYENYDVVQIKSKDKTMHLIAMYNKDCLQTCHELLQQGEKRLRVAINQMHSKSIVIDDKWANYVKNVNTKDDLKELNYAIEH